MDTTTSTDRPATDPSMQSRGTAVTMPGFHEGRAPRKKGRRYPADPPTVEEIIAVMRAAGDGTDGARPRALIVILWRAGLRIGEALDLAESDLDALRGAVLVVAVRAAGGVRSGWTVGHGRSWSDGCRSVVSCRSALCCALIRGATVGRQWESSSARTQLGRTAVKAGVRRRFAPRQLRHAHAVEMGHEGVPLVMIQRQANHHTISADP